MLDYPRTVKNDPVLLFALRRLAERSPLSRLAYYAAWPLGQLRILIITLQDHWETMVILRTTELRPDVPRSPAPINWTNLLAKAEREQATHSNDNPFGFDNSKWADLRIPIEAGQTGTNDQQYLRSMQGSLEWTDLELLLRTLKESGAQALVLSRPLNGVYLSLMGASPHARQAFYNRLRQTVQTYGFAVDDFADHDTDEYFSLDPQEHTSRKGWVYIDQALDAFYHAK
jgi:D-alanine transfer protein